MTTIVLAIIIGAAFGFALDRVGATNPGYIISMLRLGNLHLMKTILLAIGVASVVLFTGLLSGLIDPGHLSVKTAYAGVVIGGALLGLGFAAAGYCPGTGLAAAATGRKDALFFTAGGLLGAAAYMVSYAWVKATGVLDSHCRRQDHARPDRRDRLSRTGRADFRRGHRHRARRDLHHDRLCTARPASP
jgi:uncharacterized membrane protein YedE/YeeE